LKTNIIGLNKNFKVPICIIEYNHLHLKQNLLTIK